MEDNGAAVAQSGLPLSSDEQRVLELYDTLQQLRLEIAIINAQASHSSGMMANIHLPRMNPAGTHAHKTTAGNEGLEEVTEKTQIDLLDARARFQLRHDAVEAVMIANPILKAVHTGTDASPAERHVP